MSRIEIVHAERRHINHIALRIREMDRHEVSAMGSTPKRSLRKGFHYSSKPLTILDKGEPIGMMGVVPRSLIDGSGFAWLLGTEALYDYPREWALLGPRILAGFMEEYRIIENVVSVGNKRAIRFLRHLGFTIETAPTLYGGVEFVGFHYRVAAKAHH
jgi:hypothetical protein